MFTKLVWYHWVERDCNAGEAASLEAVWKPSPPGHRAERPDYRSPISN